MKCLVSSSALVGPILEAALRLTHFGWSRVSVGQEEDKDGDGDDAAEQCGREASTGHRPASSSNTSSSEAVSCFARCHRRLGLGPVLQGVSRRLCYSKCGSGGLGRGVGLGSATASAARLCATAGLG